MINWKSFCELKIKIFLILMNLIIYWIIKAYSIKFKSDKIVINHIQIIIIMINKIIKNFLKTSIFKNLKVLNKLTNFWIVKK